MDALDVIVDKGCAEAAFTRALIAQVPHCEADDDPKENVEAQLKLLENSSDGGFAAASHELAHLYSSSPSVFLPIGWHKNLVIEQDLERARELMERAAAGCDCIYPKKCEHDQKH